VVPHRGGSQEGGGEGRGLGPLVCLTSLGLPVAFDMLYPLDPFKEGGITISTCRCRSGLEAKVPPESLRQ
jgi:hypothetical protein